MTWENSETLVAKLVAATEKEPAVGDNQKTVDIFERYNSSRAAVDHVANFGQNFAKEFLSLVKPVRFVVYGMPTDELKKALAESTRIFMTPFDGFTK